jgi:dolichol-phosphate mannosyltransferase
LIQPKDKKGIGYAKIMGFKNARFPYIFYADSDNQFDLKEFKKFIPYLDKYDIIAGYRIERHDPKTRIWISKRYNVMMRVLMGAREKDLDCAFRLVNKKVINSISLICHTGVATTELLAKARKKGFRIKEIGISHYPRTLGKPIFEWEIGLNLPKPKVVIDILKETLKLWFDMKIRGN